MIEPKRNPNRFRDRAELLDYLLEVASSTQETLDLDKLLSNVAKTILRVIPAQLFAILLYSDRRKGLRIRYAVGHRQEIIDNLVIPIGEGITGEAARSREPVVVRDVKRDPRYLSALDAVRSELAVPMVARGKLVGVIDFQSTEVDAYSPSDLALVRLIATRIASAIDNARLYRRIETQHRMLRTMQKTAQNFSSILDVDELLRSIAHGVRGLMDYDAFSIRLVDEAKGVLRSRFALRFDDGKELEEIPLSRGVSGAAASSRSPIRVEDTMADERYIALHPHIRSEVAVPLILQDRLLGVMDLESHRLNNYTPDNVRVLTLLAPQVASAIENARLYEELAARERRMERDLQAARKLQSLLLPSETPDIDRLEIAVGLHPALEITGDLFDFFVYENGQAAIVFGDSSGKGAAAALYAALVGGLLRSLGHRPRTPAKLLRALNNALTERKAEAQYVTLLAMFWDAPKRRLTMANAGGLPPVICRGSQLLNPDAEGVPAGLLEEREYEEICVQMQAGDLIVLTSDGVLDAHDAKGREYGRKRLGTLIRKVCHRPVAEIVDAIYADVSKFSAGEKQFDDQTILVLRVK
jgi:phosphoserine phosphatase RsbU/P